MGAKETPHTPLLVVCGLPADECDACAYFRPFAAHWTTSERLDLHVSFAHITKEKGDDVPVTEPDVVVVPDANLWPASSMQVPHPWKCLTRQ
ncbi:unnamed protein product [Linum tenue]|uniref:Uncharacterized protein n=1 Tax=Linum tenue TaxID=586396 RepID=A0AAV0PAP5_9ROSI|nr:unnamed protein product [Linum tenue]